MTVIATSGIWRLEIDAEDFASDGSVTVHGFVAGKPRSWDVTKEVENFFGDGLGRTDLLSDFAFGLIEERLGRLEGADYDPGEGFLLTWPTPEYEDNPELNLPSREEVLGLKASEPSG